MIFSYPICSRVSVPTLRFKCNCNAFAGSCNDDLWRYDGRLDCNDVDIYSMLVVSGRNEQP